MSTQPSPANLQIISAESDKVTKFIQIFHIEKYRKCVDMF